MDWLLWAAAVIAGSIMQTYVRGEGASSTEGIIVYFLTILTTYIISRDILRKETN